MGSADVMTAVFPAGVWAADAVNRAQVLVMSGCADPATTGLRVDDAFDWLSLSGEIDLVIQRARRRTAILREIAKDDGDS